MSMPISETMTCAAEVTSTPGMVCNWRITLCWKGSRSRVHLCIDLGNSGVECINVAQMQAQQEAVSFGDVAPRAACAAARRCSGRRAAPG